MKKRMIEMRARAREFVSYQIVRVLASLRNKSFGFLLRGTSRAGGMFRELRGGGGGFKKINAQKMKT